VNKGNIANLVDPPDGLKDQILNAAIIAGFNAFSTLASLSATGLLADPKVGIVAAVISAGVSFFGSLIIQRGLKAGE